MYLIVLGTKPDFNGACGCQDYDKRVSPILKVRIPMYFCTWNSWMCFLHWQMWTLNNHLISVYLMTSTSSLVHG